MLFPIGDSIERRSVPFMTWGLILVNVAVFAYVVGSVPPEEIPVLYEEHALTPSHVEVADLFASMFLHAGFLHLFGNMLFLLVAGSSVEDRLGHGAYVLFYLAAGVTAGLTQVAFQLQFERNVDIGSVGASGAVAGVMGAYLLLFPFQRVRVLLWLFVIVHAFWVRTWAVLFLWIGVELFQGWQQYRNPDGPVQVAVFAHIGGFAFGAAFGLLWRFFSLFRRRER